jgi:hypothetical protein
MQPLLTNNINFFQLGTIKNIGLFDLLRSCWNEREVMMAAKKKDVFVVPRKIYWHLYSLQNLNSEKFIKVVNKILRREYLVIK